MFVFKVRSKELLNLFVERQGNCLLWIGHLATLILHMLWIKECVTGHLCFYNLDLHRKGLENL